MQVKHFEGQAATNREGAAEYLHIPLGTVRVYSSPGQRQKTGWPEPIRVKADADSNGQDWFAIGALDAYRQARNSERSQAPAVENPAGLLTLTEFGALRGVSRAVMYRYLELSEPSWKNGKDGMLPVPDESEPARHGTSHRWRTDRAVAWTFPSEPRRSTGRTPGRRPTADDLAQLLADPNAGSLKNRELAERLGQRLNVEVSLQVIQRLKRGLRERDAP